MTWWKKLLKGDEGTDSVDYYREGLELQRVGKYHEALTSFRLALRESPDDVAVLQQMAITFTRIGMTEEAARTYRHVLRKQPDTVGAHYGLAFLLLQEGQPAEAVEHLRAFLASPPDGPDAEAHVGHARKTLAELEGGALPSEAPAEEV
jgi:tetratricopeptide (TPR) repeat protein